MLLRGQAADAFIKVPFISGYRPGPAPPKAAGQRGGRRRARYHRRRRRSSSSAALQLPHSHSACLATCTCLFGGAGTYVLPAQQPPSPVRSRCSQEAQTPSHQCGSHDNQPVLLPQRGCLHVCAGRRPYLGRCVTLVGGVCIYSPLH